MTEYRLASAVFDAVERGDREVVETLISQQVKLLRRFKFVAQFLQLSSFAYNNLNEIVLG